MPIRFIHVVTNGKILFYYANIASCVCMCVYVFVCHIVKTSFYPSIHGHLDSFHIMVIVDNAAMNTEMHVSFQITILFF